jgi:hypothetical protein
MRSRHAIGLNVNVGLLRSIELRVKPENEEGEGSALVGTAAAAAAAVADTLLLGLAIDLSFGFGFDFDLNFPFASWARTTKWSPETAPKNALPALFGSESFVGTNRQSRAKFFPSAAAPPPRIDVSVDAADALGRPTATLRAHPQ